MPERLCCRAGQKTPLPVLTDHDIAALQTPRGSQVEPVATIVGDDLPVMSGIVGHDAERGEAFPPDCERGRG